MTSKIGFFQQTKYVLGLKHVLPACLLLSGLLLTIANVGQAQEKGNETDLQPVSAAEKKTSEQEGFQKQSFWFFGTSNYHLKLHEAESKVDRMLNTPLGLIFPRWEEPTTFKNWSDDFKIWDFWAGYGRDINEKFSWSIYGGGGAGTVPNSKRYYPLGVPLKLNMDFTRRSLMIGSSISWYPWGKPVSTGRGVMNALRASKPVAEMNIGYNHQTSIGDVTFKLPLLGDVLHIKDEAKYNLFWASPRLGVEIPLTEKDSLNLLTGYLFFHQHKDEFNGILLEFFIRHRF